MIEPVSILALIIGVALGYVLAKVLKVAVIVALVVVALAYLGITLVSRPQVEEVLHLLTPVLQWVRYYVDSSQLFVVGLLLGFAVGLFK